ncbi:hypothetical protein HAX54_001149 [Datura stramonium]|uniref:Uncharacterized protein n=1 Tax=Datura stramonium TaxID=4076 RepID=A0ABS8T2X5_DATST|nr:hypothetical protein [Datura stramonium]
MGKQPGSSFLQKPSHEDWCQSSDERMGFDFSEMCSPGLLDTAPALELGEEVQQVSLTHSIYQTDLWNSLSSSAPTPGQDNKPPLLVEQPPVVGPSEPRRDLSHVPQRSPPSLSLSDQEVLKQFFLEEGAAVEQQKKPGVPKALSLAPAPAEDLELLTTSIITKMKQLYPDDQWNLENPLIRGRGFSLVEKEKRIFVQ